MDAQRAQEIVNLPTMVNVTLNGNRVYIEHVDRDKQLATVHLLDNPNSKQSVPLSNLQEQ